MLVYCDESNLIRWENAYLALRPTLNSIHYAESGVVHSPETIERIRAATTGELNHFYGKTHSEASIAAMQLPRKGSKTVYVYDDEYKYIDVSYPTIPTRSRELPISEDFLRDHIDDGRVHQGYCYSSTPPNLNALTQVLELPFSDHFISQYFNTITESDSDKVLYRVTHKNLGDTVMCFISIKAAIKAIKYEVI